MQLTKTYLLSVITLLVSFSSVAEEVDRYFMSSQLFTGAVLKGLGNAGIALPERIQLGWNNPALVYSTCKNRCRGAVSVGYGRDSLFDRHGIPVAIAKVDGEGAMGGFYRYLSGNSGMSRHELALNFSGQLFDQVDAQGAVDFGINLRGISLTDKRYEKRTRAIERLMIDSAGHEELLGAADSLSLVYNGDAVIRRFVVDIGFYQPNIMRNLDFGLTITNLFGYRWVRQKPRLVFADSAAGDTVVPAGTNDVVVRKYRYVDETEKDRDFLASRYRTLTIGVAYRTGTEAFRLTLPMDLVLLGLFDKKLENGFVFRGGAALELGDAITLRLGYAREPKTILEGVTTFKNVNIFSGGAGLRVGQTFFDCYIADESFGFTVEYRL